MKKLEDAKYEVGEVIDTYVYRKDEPIELTGTYEYNTSSIIIFFCGLLVIVGIICYWLEKKKNK